MSKRVVLKRSQTTHPHDFLEDLALSNEWAYERPADHRMVIEIDGFSCPLTVVSHWEDQSGYLELMGIFDMSVPENRYKDAFEVLAALSLDTRIGHFAFDSAEARPFFRHAFVAYPKNPLTVRHFVDVFEDLLSGGEKLCQAMYFLLEENKTAEEAVFASLMDVMGEA